jgi:RNA polymerase sigma-70 factor, ECF subfamily
MTLVTMQPAASEDARLVEEVLGGNPLSFQLLVERYQERIFALARRYTKNAVEIEDIAQDTFLKVYRRLDSFQRHSSFSTWLYRIALNTALDFLKRTGRSPVRAVEDPELTAEPVRAQAGSGVSLGAPESRLRREEIARVTQEALEELPEIFRTVLVLRELEGFSYQEMAETLGISIGTIESRLFRARARFKEALIRLHPEFANGE